MTEAISTSDLTRMKASGKTRSKYPPIGPKLLFLLSPFSHENENTTSV